MTETSAIAAPSAPQTATPRGRGCGAHGSFTVTQDITKLTRAGMFAERGARTAVLARFSADAGHDAEPGRDPRGVALKFYTDEGNWDLVGHNSPVFWIRDPAKFPALTRALARDPASGRRDAASLWDFCSRNPETLHQITFLMSDRGLPSSPRAMGFYGGHTYSFWNAAGARHWVKLHFRTLQDGAFEPPADFWHDLPRAIAGGAHPCWQLCVQVMTEREAADAPFDPFDLTKVWPRGAYPLHEVGTLTLDRNPNDPVAEIEQAAFSPSNVVPGIGFSPDRMLQARVFAYADAHRRRLGAHYESLPANAPRMPVRHYQAEAGTRPARPTAAPAEAPPPEPRMRGGEDDFGQPRALFRGLDGAQRARLLAALQTALAGVPCDIVARQVVLFRMVDDAYGAGVARLTADAA